MAKRPSYYEKFTITSIPDSASGGGFSIPDYEKDIRAIINQAVKSALSEGEFFKASSRVVDKTTGETKVDVYVHPESANVVADSLNAEMKKFKYRGGTDYRYSVSNRPSSKSETEAIAKYESSGKEPEYQRQRSGSILKLIGLVTSVIDITRRILSSVLNFSTQTVRDMTTAHNYGMSYEAVRTYHKIEKGHGLKEGTITGAVSDIQNKFGNITSLDEKALEALAVVMGGKIEEMATMGLGSSNPEAILGVILDAFNEKANAGYNSVGQYVGEQQARRELYSYLSKVSPQIADIFATMQEEQHNLNSIFRNQFETFDEWKELFPTIIGGHIPEELQITYTLGQEWNQVQKTLDSIKEHFTASFAPSVLDLLRDIKNVRWGMTTSENMQTNIKNREANEQELARVNNLLHFYDEGEVKSDAEKYYIQALLRYKDELEKANEGDRNGNIDNAIRTYTELKVLASAIAQDSMRTTVAGESSYTAKDTMSKTKPVFDVTSDQILELLSGFNKFDLDEEKKNYEKEIEKANKKVTKNNVRVGSKTRQKAEREIEDLEESRWKAKKESADTFADIAIKDKNSPYYLTPLQRSVLINPDIGRSKDLARVEYYHNVKLIGDSIYDKEKYAVEHGYAKWDIRNGIKYGIIPSATFDKSSLVSEQERIEIKKKAGLDEVGKQEYFYYNEEDFLHWLYENNADWFNENFASLELEKIKEQISKGTPLTSLFLLQRDEAKWIDKLPTDIGEGMGELYGVNTVNINGENVYKLILEFGTENDKRRIELNSYAGSSSAEGNWGKFRFIRNDDGTVDWTASIAQTASEQRISELKEKAGD